MKNVNISKFENCVASEMYTIDSSANRRTLYAEQIFSFVSWSEKKIDGNHVYDMYTQVRSYSSPVTTHVTSPSNNLSLAEPKRYNFRLQRHFD